MSKKDGYTIKLASGTESVPLTLEHPDGSLLKFRIPVLNDKIKSLRIQKFQSLTTDAQVVDYMVELLYKAADEGVTEAQIRGAVTHEEATESARAQILGLLVSGQLTDPKIHAQLLAKITNRMMDQIVAAI